MNDTLTEHCRAVNLGICYKVWAAASYSRRPRFIIRKDVKGINAILTITLYSVLLQSV